MLRILIIAFITQFFFIVGSNANIEIKARTAILQDYLSGEILYEK